MKKVPTIANLALHGDLDLVIVNYNFDLWNQSMVTKSTFMYDCFLSLVSQVTPRTS